MSVVQTRGQSNLGSLKGNTDWRKVPRKPGETEIVTTPPPPPKKLDFGYTTDEYQLFILDTSNTIVNLYNLCSHLRPGAIICKLRLHSTGARALIHDLKDLPTIFMLNQTLQKQTVPCEQRHNLSIKNILFKILMSTQHFLFCFIQVCVWLL